MTSSHELAVRFGMAGRLCYENHGHAEPQLMLLDSAGRGLVVQLTNDLHPRVMCAAVLEMLAPVVDDLSYAVVVMEAWTKNFDADADQLPERGDLSKMHEEGDLSVRTCVSVACFDLKDPEKSGCEMSVNVGLDHIPEWDIHGSYDGKPEGAIADAIFAAYAASLNAPRPPERFPLEVVAETITSIGMVAAAAVI